MTDARSTHPRPAAAGGSVRALVLDFDGLLVESEEIKDAAFADVFAEFAEHRDAIAAYLEANRHVVRYEKFRHVTESIVGRPYTPDVERRMCDRYADLTRRQIVACPSTPGADAFLDYFCGRLPMVLASVTPQAELDAIVDGRRLRPCFEAVHGAPTRKTDVLRAVMARHNARPSQVVMVGDSCSDLDAALAVGALFVGRNRKDDFAARGAVSFDDLRDARDYIIRLADAAQSPAPPASGRADRKENSRS